MKPTTSRDRYAAAPSDESQIRLRQWMHKTLAHPLTFLDFPFGARGGRGAVPRFQGLPAVRRRRRSQQEKLQLQLLSTSSHERVLAEEVAPLAYSDKSSALLNVQNSLLHSVHLAPWYAWRYTRRV